MIKIISQPKRKDWERLCNRPNFATQDLDKRVNQILMRVKQEGDEALFNYTEQFDKVSIKTLKVSKEEIAESRQLVSEDLKKAISVAKGNIERFHRTQLIAEPPVEIAEGITCWRKNVPIEKVGLYIPGGSAPLFSTILMLGIPAIIAGCKKIVLCTPCGKNGKIHPAVLYTAQLLGIESIYKVGGAQAIAAMAYGTASIERVNKIFGPGNQYVTKAKELVQQDGVAIDLPAGPSEVLVIADKTCIPEFVAADLLSQAEHGPDSQVVLLTNDQTVAQAVQKEIEKQVTVLSRREIAKKAMEKSFIAVLEDINMCLEWSDFYAPEHLILAIDKAEVYAGNVRNAGSVFLGNYSCESAGDYASGTNHTLPTNGFSKSYSGVSVDSFIKKITFQKIEPEGMKKIGPIIEKMATEEGLFAHKNAVSVRLRELKTKK